MPGDDRPPRDGRADGQEGVEGVYGLDGGMATRYGWMPGPRRTSALFLMLTTAGTMRYGPIRDLAAGCRRVGLEGDGAAQLGAAGRGQHGFYGRPRQPVQATEPVATDLA